MAKKISQLTQATQVKSDDVTVIVQDGETKKLPLNMMVTKQDIEDKKVAGLAKLDEIEATYENDTYTPTITVENKSSVKTGEGDGVDYSANVMEGPAKSAILTGNTLVNLVGEKREYTNGNLYGWEFMLPYNLTSGKTYLAVFNATGTINDTNAKVYLMDNAFNSNAGNTPYPVDFKIGHNRLKCIASNDIHRVLRIRTGGQTKNDLKVSDVMFFEYQEGMENWDIPYFEGMQSVKLPVLTTTGKNLIPNDGFSDSTFTKSEYGININKQTEGAWIYMFEDCLSIPLKRGNYFYSSQLVTGEYLGGVTQFIFSDGTYSKELINDNVGSQLIWTLDLETDKVLTGIRVWNAKGNCTMQFQLVEGTQETSYEPYKSNILTVNEDVVLRGIGDVRDTLDCLTGEVTERIGEIVLNGSEDWNIHPYSTDDFLFIFTDIANMKTKNALCDKMPTWNGTAEGLRYQTQSYIWGNAGNTLFVWFEKSKLSEATTKGFKKYLQSNPIILHCQLATESIKTVDLIPSGTHPSTTPYCWKDGHIQLSSSGLLPSLEYSVVTSRAGQISQNAAMIVKNDKRIFDLEILLAGGLVNTTYQALTLQNQVETGLSKVSLSSEKEPDYLLYHMIMKLIEEKAYKLDDLAEKVSVFYLYEKLSDEQFETIYSELYPFVEEEYIELPEDGEIIEEPIVDEVLEEVENGVVM